MTTQHSPIRLALIGAGIFARDTHAPALLRQPESYQIVAVWSRSDASATALAQSLPGGLEAVTVSTDLAGLLQRDDIDAVDVVAPIDAMPPLVEAALASGKHLISEKPIAPDLAAARRLLAAWDGSQQWMVAENWRYESAFVLARDLVQSGAIGRPLTCHWALYLPMTPASKYFQTPWRRSGQLAGGLILDGGVHHVAALRMILGEITAVTAQKTQISADLPPHDTMVATLHFANGVLGSYLVSYATGAPWQPDLHIVGTAGSLRLRRGLVELTQEGAVQTLPCPALDGVANEFAAFAQAVQRGQPHINTPRAALQDLAVVDALLRSAEERRERNSEQ